MDDESRQSDSSGSTPGDPEDQDLGRTSCTFCEEWPNLLVHEDTEWNENEDTLKIPYVAGKLHGDQRLLLHESCSKCANATDEDNGELCDFCRHIRLRHLLYCEDSGFNHADGTYMGTYLGTVAEVSDRQYDEECSMCGVITRCIDSLEAQGVDWEDIEDEEVWLWFKKSHLVLRATRRKDGSFRSWYFGYRLLRSELSKNTARKDEHQADQQPAVIGEKTDWNQVKTWLEECRRYHQTCNSDTTGFWDPQFRVIDVHERMVTRFPSHQCKFVALSYVWGTGPENENGQSTKASMKKLETPGGLDDLPATIQDAMEACAHLGERFLWVDRLCIIQDDSEDKSHQLGLMGQIYSSADFVLVAAGIKEAKDGLQGVSRPRAQTQFQARVLDIEFTHILPELEQSLRRSKWGSRGWTFQEDILAKKKLYFTASEVWFVCEGGGHREDQYGTDESLKTGSGALRTRLRLSSAFGDYARLASQYAGRTLTNQSDVYDAFGGIQNMLYPDTKTIYGLPECDFNDALLWTMSDDSVRPKHREAQGATLSSWSWSSIQGQIEYGDENLGSMCFPLVRWAYFDEGTICSIKSSDYNRPWRTDYSRKAHVQTFLAIAWTEGCIETKSPFQFGEMDEDWEDETPFPVSRKDLEERWPTPSHFLDDVSLSSASNGPYDGSRIREIAFQDEDIMKNLQRPGVLLVRAQVAQFDVEITRRWRLRSITGPETGFHRGEWFKAAGGLVSFDEFKLRTGMRRGDKRRTEFMALSVAIPPRGFWNLCDRDELRDYNYSTPDFDELQPPPVLIVMAIDRQGRFARRLGIGHIYLKRWALAEPEFENILLV